MEKVKTYFGEYVWNVGKPIVILTGYESGNEIHCERVIILETGKEPETLVSGMKADKQNWKTAQEFFSEPKSDEQLMDQFMDSCGLDPAKGDLFGMIVDIGEKKQLELHSRLFNPSPELRINQTVGTIMYLKRKLPTQFEQLRGLTKCKELKKLMDIAKGIIITDYKQE